MPTRPCWVEVSTRALENNYRFLRSVTPPAAELLAIVKADAYGHAISICAPAAVRAGARWLGVTSVEEGLAARSVCPDAEILVMGGIFPGQGPRVLKHKISAVVWTAAQIDELEQAARAANAVRASVAVHLEIDTGMSRQGVSVDGLPTLLARFGVSSPLRLDAVMTHLFASDESNGIATAEQLKCLEQAMREVRRTDLEPEWLSVGASAALLGNESEAIASLASRWGIKPMLRPGLALYGVVPRYNPPFEPGNEPRALSDARDHLQPALTWKTRVASVRDLPAGAGIGYNGTFIASERMRVALLPAGYGDGLDRRLGNRFSLLVRGQRAPLVGRISMDQTVLDVTEIAGVETGDEVVILGTQGDETITAFDHADAAGTIPWEVFTSIAPRVTRVAIE